MKFKILFLVLLTYIFSFSVHGQVSNIIGSNLDASPPPPPPPCSIFNISGPISSVNIGKLSTGTVPRLSELGFRVISSSNTFAVSYKQQDVIGGGRTLHLKVGVAFPLSIIIDNSLVSWPPNAEEDTYVMSGSANGYIINTRPSAFFQPLNRRSILVSADTGVVFGTINYSVSTSMQVFQSTVFGHLFDGGVFYVGASIGSSSGFIAFKHGFSSSLVVNPVDLSTQNVGDTYDGVSKIYTVSGSVNIARWSKWNGSTIVHEETVTSGIFNPPNNIRSISFGNGKLFVSGTPISTISILIARFGTIPLNLEQSAFISAGDGATYNGAASIYDRFNNKFYVVSNSSVGRRIFRVNPTNLSVEQTFTISGGGLAFFISDSALQIKDDGRILWTFESDSNNDQYVIRAYSLCS